MCCPDCPGGTIVHPAAQLHLVIEYLHFTMSCGANTSRTSKIGPGVEN